MKTAVSLVPVELLVLVHNIHPPLLSDPGADLSIVTGEAKGESLADWIDSGPKAPKMASRRAQYVILGGPHVIGYQWLQVR